MFRVGGILALFESFVFQLDSRVGKMNFGAVPESFAQSFKRNFLDRISRHRLTYRATGKIQ